MEILLYIGPAIAADILFTYLVCRGLDAREFKKKKEEEAKQEGNIEELIKRQDADNYLDFED